MRLNTLTGSAIRRSGLLDVDESSERLGRGPVCNRLQLAADRRGKAVIRRIQGEKSPKDVVHLLTHVGEYSRLRVEIIESLRGRSRLEPAGEAEEQQPFPGLNRLECAVTYFRNGQN